MDLIRTALANGQSSLSEFQAKKLLKSYDIPVTREILAVTAPEAVSAAEKIGYPVVLKACAPHLMHKSDIGAVALNLKNAREVETAYRDIAARLDITPDGMLVQEMVIGDRELVVGLTREPQFGPCVMLGIGGVMTEILADTVFRVAPFEIAEAEDMLAELRSNKILDAFRGQKPADRHTLYRILAAVGEIGLVHPAVSEIDINPLIITPAGRIVAVDALFVLDSGSDTSTGGIS